jgi:hypothetical protein
MQPRHRKPHHCHWTILDSEQHRLFKWEQVPRRAAQGLSPEENDATPFETAILAGTKIRTLTLILQHIGRYYDPYLLQSYSDPVSKVWTPQFPFMVRSHPEIIIASGDICLGIDTGIDRYLRCAD